MALDLQLAFTFKTVFKALDVTYILYSVIHVYMGQHAHFCANLLCSAAVSLHSDTLKLIIKEDYGRWAS